MPEAGQWGLLATAVSGRHVQVVCTTDTGAYTDGDVLYLGREDGTATVVAQAALLAAGSLAPSVVSRLVGRRALRSRYLTLEARRAAHVLGDVLPTAVASRMAALHDGPVSSSADASLRAAADDDVAAAPGWLGTIRPMKLLRLTGLESFETKADDATGDERLADRDLGGDDPEDGKVGDAPGSTFTTSVTSKLASWLGMGRASRAGMAGTGQEMAIVGDRLGAPSGNARRTDAPDWLRLHTGSDYPFGRRYDEWSAECNSYLSGHCAVAEFDPRVRPDDAPLVTSSDAALRRQLARLGLANQVYRGQPDGDVLDITALVDVVVATHAGARPDPRVYERRRRTAHDLGVVVLLDATGSTGQSTEGRQVFAAQRELAGRLTTTLEQLGDRVALYGFHSMGREDVRFLRVKTFDDRYSHAAQRRLAALAPTGFTRLGAAVRHATHLLVSDAGTSKMLLVLIGDGLPYEQGYEERYAQEDTRRALSEAVARGVGCACVSLRATTDERVVERVWGHVAHRRLQDADELAAHVQPLFRHALKEAAASRRPTTSPERRKALAAL